MKGSRPEQASLSKNTDLSKTDETRRVIESMVDGLNDHRIDDIGEFFSKNFSHTLLILHLLKLRLLVGFLLLQRY